MASKSGEPRASVLSLERQAELAEFARQRATEPRDYFARLRGSGPVDFDEGMNGLIQVLKRNDVERVLRDTELFSNVVGNFGSEEAVIPLGVDPPLHGIYRRVLDPLLNRRRMEELAPTVASHVKSIIDGFIESGSCDFANDLAVPLPCSTFSACSGYRWTICLS